MQKNNLNVNMIALTALHFPDVHYNKSFPTPEKFQFYLMKELLWIYNFY